MRLVVDTNRIIAALIKDSVSREIILSGKLELITIRFALSEARKHKKYVLAKTGLTEERLDELITKLFDRIYIVPDSLIKSNLPKAIGMMEDIDPTDAPFISLALSVENDGIWSDDKHFAKQKTVKIWKTGALLKYI